MSAIESGDCPLRKCTARIKRKARCALICTNFQIGAKHICAAINLICCQAHSDWQACFQGVCAYSGDRATAA